MRHGLGKHSPENHVSVPSAKVAKLDGPIIKEDVFIKRRIASTGLLHGLALARGWDIQSIFLTGATHQDSTGNQDYHAAHELAIGISEENIRKAGLSK